MMVRHDRQVVLEFKGKIPKTFRCHMKKVIVFGSRAHGEAKKDSDLDLAVLVDKKNTHLMKALDDTAYEVMWDHDFKPVISLKVFAQTAFNKSLRKGFSFYRHVALKGVSV